MIHPLTFPRYLVLTDFGAEGVKPCEKLYATFRDASQDWAEQTKKIGTSWVVEARLNAPLLDVTDEAREAELWHCVKAHGDIPGWLLEAPGDEGDAPEQRGWDAAKVASDDQRAA
jgi:hypothetical protein